jgi:hypothetical protein
MSDKYISFNYYRMCTPMSKSRRGHDHRLETLDLELFHEPNLVHALQTQRINIAIALGTRLHVS